MTVNTKCKINLNFKGGGGKTHMPNRNIISCKSGLNGLLIVFSTKDWVLGSPLSKSAIMKTVQPQYIIGCTIACKRFSSMDYTMAGQGYRGRKGLVTMSKEVRNVQLGETVAPIYFCLPLYS